MYNFPENSKEFKRGYAIGVNKGLEFGFKEGIIEGRKREKRMALLLVVGFVIVFEFMNVIFIKIVCK